VSLVTEGLVVVGLTIVGLVIVLAHGWAALGPRSRWRGIWLRLLFQAIVWILLSEARRSSRG